PKIMADVYASVATIPPPLMASMDAFANVGKVAIPTTESIIGPMKQLAEQAAAYEAETRRQVDAWNEGKRAGDEFANSTKKAAEETKQATQIIVQMNTALGQNKTALDSVLAGHQLMAAYAKTGVAMGSTIATGGYDFALMQETNVPTTNVARGLVTPGAAYSNQPWGNQNTLNVN